MIDPDTTKRLILARIREWNANVGGVDFFDNPGINSRINEACARKHTSVGTEAGELLRESPEAGLDYG